MMLGTSIRIVSPLSFSILLFGNDIFELSVTFHWLILGPGPGPGSLLVAPLLVVVVVVRLRLVLLSGVIVIGSGRVVRIVFVVQV